MVALAVCAERGAGKVSEHDLEIAAKYLKTQLSPHAAKQIAAKMIAQADEKVRRAIDNALENKDGAKAMRIAAAEYAAKQLPKIIARMGVNLQKNKNLGYLPIAAVAKLSDRLYKSAIEYNAEQLRKSIPYIADDNNAAAINAGFYAVEALARASAAMYEGNGLNWKYLDAYFGVDLHEAIIGGFDDDAKKLGEAIDKAEALEDAENDGAQEDDEEDGTAAQNSRDKQDLPADFVNALRDEQKARIKKVLEMATKLAEELRAAEEKRAAELESKLKESEEKRGDASKASKKYDREELTEWGATIEKIRQIGIENQVDFKDSEQMAFFLGEMVKEYLIQVRGFNREAVEADADKEARAEIYKTIRRRLAKMLRDLCPESGAARQQAQKMISEMPQSLDYQGIMNASARILRVIQRAAIRESKNNLIKDFRKKLAQLAKLPHMEMGTDQAQKISAASSEKIRYIRRVLLMGSAETRHEKEHYNAIKEGRAAAYEDAVGNAEAAENDAAVQRAAWRLQILEMLGDFRHKPVADMRKLREATLEYCRGEMLAHEKKWAQWNAENEELAAAARLAANAAGPNRPEPGKTEGFFGRPLRKFWLFAISTVRQQLEYAFANASSAEGKAAAERVTSSIMRSIYDAETRHTLLLERFREEKAAAIADAAAVFFDGVATVDAAGKGNIEKFMKHLDEPISQDAARALIKNGRNIPLTYAQAIQLFASLKQASSYGENIKANGREGDLDFLLNILHPADIRLCENLRRIYDARRGELSAAMEEITGLPVFSPDPYYMLVKMDMGAREGFGMKGMPFAPFAKSLSPRISNKRDFDLAANVLSIYDDRSADAAHAIAFGKTALRIKAVLMNAELKEILKRQSGADFLRRFEDHLKDTCLQKPEQELKTPIDSMFSAFGTLSAYAGLSWNFGTAAKQATSACAFALRHPRALRMCIEAANPAVWTDPVWLGAFDKIKKSDGWAARYGKGGSIMAETADLVARGGKKANIIERFWQKGMDPISWGDAVPTLFLGPALYIDSFERNLAHGMSAKEAEKAALTDVWAMVEETQQSGRISNRPEFSRRGGPILRLVLQFSTSPIQQASHEAAAFMNWARKVDPEGKLNFAQKIRKSLENRKRGFDDGSDAVCRAVLVNHLFMPAFMWSVGNLLKMSTAELIKLCGGDDDGDNPFASSWLELVAACITGQFSRFVVFGAIFDSSVRRLLGLQTFGRSASEIPAVSAASKVFFNGVTTAKDLINFEWEKWAGDVFDMLYLYRGAKAVDQILGVEE